MLELLYLIESRVCAQILMIADMYYGEPIGKSPIRDPTRSRRLG